MSRKQCKRKKYQARAPMLVIRQTIPDLGIAEHMAVEAFVGGWAEGAHFDVLADARNMLMLAGASKGDKQALTMSRLAEVALHNIRARHAEKGRFGATGEEISALRELVAFSQDFWSRQSGATYHDNYAALLRAERAL